MSALITGAFLRRVFGAAFLIFLFILAAYCMRLIYADMTYVKHTFYADVSLAYSLSVCVIGYEEKTANGKIQKEQEQSEARPDGA